MRKILLLLPLVAIALSGCQSKRSGNEVNGGYTALDGVRWTTSYHIIYDSPEDLSQQIAAVFDSIDNSLSVFNPDSYINKINRNQTKLTDEYIGEVMTASQRFCDLSGGRFDPTVSPLVDLWGFGNKNNSKPSPTKEEIDNCLASVGILDCRLEPEFPDSIVDEVYEEHGEYIFDDFPRRYYLTKKSPQTQFNFSAIAKGYACDKIAEMLSGYCIHNYLIEIGGEIRMAGHNPHGEDWTIAIDAPEDAAPGTEVIDKLQLTDCGVATSGNYRNYHTVDGQTRGHIIHPLTGYPYQSPILSATVIAKTAMTADAIATTLMMMPDIDVAHSFVEDLWEDDDAGIYCAILITRGADGNYVTTKIGEEPSNKLL